MADAAHSGISSIGFSLIRAWQGKPQSRTMVSREIKNQGKRPTSNTERSTVLIGRWALRVERWTLNLLRRFWTWHQEHRTSAVFQHAFSSATYQQVIHRAMSMRTHHNQIGVKLIRLIQNFFGYRSGRFV